LDLSYKINLFLKEKGMSKKFFAEKLIALEPILKSTREVPSASTIYGYLNGSREIKAELLPYIAKVLDVGISELFEDNKKDRLKILQNILENPSQEEQKLLENYFKFEEKLSNQKLQNDTNYHLYNYILQMLPYASEKFLYTLIDLLESYKDSTKRAQEDIKNLDFNNK
jgi:transcriptional regulator with XRE-family HTH domain